MFEIFGLGFLSGIIFVLWILMKKGIIIIKVPKKRKNNGKGPT